MTPLARRVTPILMLAVAAVAAVAVLGSPTRARAAARPPIRHVVEIMLENHTFDSLFAGRRGDGVPPGTTLPAPASGQSPVAPFTAGPNQGSVGASLDSSRAGELVAMDPQPGGRFGMDGYTRAPDDGLASITTFAPSDDPNLQFLAGRYALAVANFQPEVAPTQPNVTAAVNGDSGGWYSNGTPPATERFHTIFDELQAARRSWDIFYGVPPSLLGGTIWDRYQPPRHTGRVLGTDRFVADAAAGRLPAFSFVRPGFGYSEESPEDLSQGDAWLGQLVAAIMRGPEWPSTAVFITYDEGGGFWDHVSPPPGEGTRTPLVAVSPYTRPGVIRQATTNLSVLSFLQHLWGLRPLSASNRRAPDLFGVFDARRGPAVPHLPPVDPPATLRMAEVSGLVFRYTAVPGRPVEVDLRAETAGLDRDAALSGRIALTATGPAGAPPAAVPAAVPATGGRARFTATFPAEGYWRITAAGPDGTRGWATFSVGAGADTP